MLRHHLTITIVIINMSNTLNLTEKALNTYKNRANNVHYRDHQSIVMNRKTKTLHNTITVLSPKSHLQTKELITQI